jgi:hypothetical protein
VRYLIQTLTHVIYIIEMMNPCDVTPCQNGGTCTRLSGVSYWCDCATGYSGTNCQGIIWLAHNYIYNIYNLENSKFANNGNNNLHCAVTPVTHTWQPCTGTAILTRSSITWVHHFYNINYMCQGLNQITSYTCIIKLSRYNMTCT